MNHFYLGLAGALALTACSADGDMGQLQARRSPRPPAASPSGNGDDATRAPSNGTGDAPATPADGAPATPTTPTPPTPSSAPDAAAPAPSSATGGSGGLTGFQVLKSAGGLDYQMNAAPPTAGKPQGLLVLLHGSTASNYTKMVAMMESVATRYDLIRVSVLAPNGAGWNEGDQVKAADLLHRVVQEDLYPKFNIDKSKVFFSGQSSGGGFLSSHFVPIHGSDYRGGAFLQCGAAPPAVTFAPDAATKQGFRLHFEITSADPIWPASYARAVTAYSAAGMQLTKDDTKPGGHCAFDQQQVIVDHIAPMLGP